ncbi:DUF4268 domain-containing protein [Wenyingzhuangia sp. 2_MG-2023]|uniref:DUF4268 domain-containing protein n=1 Tax=Wenyingzhuangia sp. 2_MG-2023 TaxID=3062639 RepID=UPI0026E2FE85|nr:DUF4268 domain-containing protein [Wenyingzhuangia sp. 2_MG-2023]MDO6739058.1 DUF4268 domain-containing protein [Wenyingzhuangia sp. 2_MG-2023]
MFSREEAASIRKEFWVSYGKSFPRKWVLYNTKIKDFSFKFVAERKMAAVVLDIETSDVDQRELLFDQLISLKKILETEYLPNVIFDKDYYLENGKHISRVYVLFDEKYSIYNKATWSNCYAFFNETMHQFELFWYEYQDYIEQAVVK